jgi:hypothetical protein
MNIRSYESSKFPDWPMSFKGYPPAGNEGSGLLGSKFHLPDLDGGPDPVKVKAWMTSKLATVSETCEHFGLSRVQVIKVAGK